MGGIKHNGFKDRFPVMVSLGKVFRDENTSVQGSDGGHTKYWGQDISS